MIRVLAHLAGWHTQACGSDLRCVRPLTNGLTIETARNGRWWRYVTPCCDDTCPEDHA